MYKKDLYKQKGLAPTSLQPKPDRHLHQGTTTAFHLYKRDRQRRDKGGGGEGKGNKVSKRELLDPLTRKADHMVSFILVT